MLWNGSGKEHLQSVRLGMSTPGAAISGCYNFFFNTFRIYKDKELGPLEEKAGYFGAATLPAVLLGELSLQSDPCHIA